MSDLTELDQFTLHESADLELVFQKSTQKATRTAFCIFRSSGEDDQKTDKTSTFASLL